MVKMTKLDSAGQAQEYYKTEFSSSQQKYFSDNQTVSGQWSGKLAEEWGLEGPVTEEQFARLTEGQHPVTGEQLIRNVEPHSFTNAAGETITTNGHVPGWDITFSAPKSISAQAIYGESEELREGLREAHDRAVHRAMEAYEEYAMARMGGSKDPERTGKLVAVAFEHDTARPVNGVASPELHTHVIAANMAQTEDGKVHSLQTEEMYKAQNFATSVYRSELAYEVRALGFEVDRGKYGEPEIKGISREYIDEISLRREQINERARETGFDGANAKNLYALQTRKGKHEIDEEKTHLSIREAAQRHGIDFAKLEREALERGPQRAQESEVKQAAKQSLEYSRDHHSERSATFRQDRLVADALDKGMGIVRRDDIVRELEERQEAGEYQVRRQARTSPVLTTRAMQQKEQQIIAKMQQGQGKMKPFTRDTAALLKEVHASPVLQQKRLTLNEAQERVFHEVMNNTDQIQAVNGFAGTGKTTELEAMKVGWEAEGYTVRGFGTTGKNTNQLGETGMKVETLASHLQKGDKAHQEGGNVVYVLDESSMASTSQAHQFLTELRPNERAVLVGDTRQHQSVGWGKPFEQLQDAGMHTAELDKIVRQKNPALEEMVYRLESNDVAGAIQIGRENNVFVEENDPQKRLDYITEQALQYREAAQERKPGETIRQHEARQKIILVTPENARKQEINETLRVKMQQRGMIGKEDYRINVLVARQEVTQAQKTWAEKYEVGDTLKYYKANKRLGISKDDSARVIAKNAERNTITVAFEAGKKGGRQLTYDPSKGGNGVAIYREAKRTFSPGQEVQFTAKARFGHVEVKNRDLGKFQSMDEQGNITIRHESGHDVRFHASQYRNLEQGGCYTSQIAQGQTAGMSGGDFGAKNPDLVTFRAALITASRAQHECKIVAPDLAEMERLIKREVSNETALPESKYRAEGRSPEQTRRAAAHQQAPERRPARIPQPQKAVAGLREELRPEFGCRKQDGRTQARRSLEAELRSEFPTRGQSANRQPSNGPTPDQVKRQAHEAQLSLSGTLGRERTQTAVREDLAAVRQQPGAVQKQGAAHQQPNRAPEQGNGLGEGLAPGDERQHQHKQGQEQGLDLSI